jgi:hypothetical protein
MRWGAVLGGLLGVWVAGCDGAVCDAGVLEAALTAATPGTVVTANGCRYEGAFEVPPGVILRGQGPGQTVLESAEGIAVQLGPGASLEALTVRAVRGRGIEARGVVSLRDVEVRGPVVDRAAADRLPPLPDASTTATHGVVLVAAGTAETPVELVRVDVRGFARFGVLAVDSHVRWEGGASSESAGTGVAIRGGSATLREVEVCSVWRGLSPYGYGMVATGGARIESAGLVLCDNESAGVLHDDASARHTGLRAHGNASGGVWSQRSAELALDGAELADNALAGLVLVDTPSATVRDTRIESTRSALTILPDGGEARIGDGLQAVLADASGLRLERVTLVSNARVGLLLDLEATTVPAESLVDVVVEAEGDGLGALAQTADGVVDAAAWSGGIERRGTAAANDAAAVDRLSVLGAVAPMFLPPPDP